MLCRLNPCKIPNELINRIKQHRVVDSKYQANQEDTNGYNQLSDQGKLSAGNSIGHVVSCFHKLSQHSHECLSQ